MNETVSIMTVSSTDNVQQPKKEAAKKLTNDTRTELNYRTTKFSSKASSNLCELLASGTTIRLSVYSALLCLSSILSISFFFLVSLYGLGPVLIYANLPQDCLGQSEGSKELARKCRPIIELTGTRAKVGQSERLQEPRECRPIRVQRGTRAQSISQSEGC